MAVTLPRLIDVNPAFLLQTATYSQPRPPSDLYEQLIKAHLAAFLPWQMAVGGLLTGLGRGLGIRAQSQALQDQQTPSQLPSLIPGG